MSKEIVEGFKEKTNKSINYFREELKGIRTGRASVTLFEGIKVDYYGTMTPLPGVATLAVPDARTVTITPWEPSLIKEIEKAIQASQMGFNPSNDGKLIRVPFPQLNEERRKELVKVIKKIAEDCKVAIRNERRDANDKIKKSEKDKAITEDDSKRFQDEIQVLTDKVIKNIDEITAVKEKEVMEI